MSLSRLGFFALSGAGAVAAATGNAGAEVASAPHRARILSTRSRRPNTTARLCSRSWIRTLPSRVSHFRDGFGNTIATNVFDKARTAMSVEGGCDKVGSVYQDYTGEAVRKRGGGMMVCYNALSGFANGLADALGTDGTAIFADLMHHMIPGYLLVPSGVSTFQLAQDHNWKAYTM
jgi:hypothetical protein